MSLDANLGELNVRPPVMADASAVAGLINLCAMLETGTLQITVEHVLAHWRTPGFDLATDARVVEGPGGRMVGYVEVRAHGLQAGLVVWIRIHPDYTGGPLGGALLRLAERRALEVCGRVILRAATLAVNHDTRRLLNAAGFRLAQRLWSGDQDADRAADRSALLPGWPEEMRWISLDGRAPVRYDVYEKELRDDCLPVAV